METVLLIGTILLLLGGLAGSLLPVLPGPPLSFFGLLLLNLTERAHFSTKFLIIMSVAMIVITVVDYLIPIYGTKKLGGSKAGIRGSTAGLILGIFFFPPFGMLFGPLIGAFVGELIVGKRNEEAFRSAIGSFIGFLTGTIIKIIYSLLSIYFTIQVFYS